MMTVAVLTYYSPLEKTVMTLDSILKQEYSDYEIIVCDDASVESHFAEIEAFFKRNHFSRYRLIQQPQNVGTVRNLRSACEIGTGKYIKGIGSGDLFYNQTTFRDVIEFMEQKNSTFTFGLWSAYSICNEEVEYLNMSAPRDIKTYLKGNQKLIGKNILLKNDWISGATIFFSRESLLEQRFTIHNEVRYCEDLVQVLFVLEKEQIDFYPGYVVWYEVGAGISTSQNGPSSRLLQDHERFFESIISKYKMNSLVMSYVSIKNEGRILRRLRFEKMRIFRKLGVSRDLSVEYTSSGFLSPENRATFLYDHCSNEDNK